MVTIVKQIGILSCTGKSNLMDAISFVLGEKTQHLRVRNLRVRLVCVETVCKILLKCMPV